MKKRETELDILRLLALFAVIWVHVGGMETNSLPTSDPNCQWLIFLKSIMTWEIPVFVMISGRFFLDPERDMPFSKILKSVGRLVLAFAVWNVVYQTYYIVTDSYSGLNWKGILSQAVIGPYHFWYLYMIVGMYLVVPFLRKIAQDKCLSEYFIFLHFLFMLLTRYIVKFPFIGSTVSTMLGSMGMNLVLGYSGYYILGYYLRKYPISDIWEKVLYFCGAVLLLLGAIANTRQSVLDGAYTEQYTLYTAPNTILIASAIYTLFIKRISKIRMSEKFVNVISGMSIYSFGIYLIHALVLDIFAKVGLKPTIMHPMLSMPLLTFLGFAVTALIVAIIRRIPEVGEKIT